MRLIKNVAFDKSEKKIFTSTIWSNTIESMAILLKEMKRFNLTLSKPENQKHAVLVASTDFNQIMNSFPIPLAKAIQSLWSDSGVKACYEHRSEF